MTSPSPTGPANPTLLRMAAPLVVSFWMRAAVTFVDTIYAALLGDAAVAAIGLAIPFEFLMIALWVGLSTGLTSGLSRAMGAGNGGRVEQYVAATWRLVGVLGPLFTLVGVAIWFAAPRMGLAPDVEQAFRVYGTVLIAGSAFTSFWSVIPDSLVKAHQDTRTTMWAGIYTNILNLGLNTLFLFVFHWGILGIALSTALSRIGGLLYALARARVHEARRRSEQIEAGPTDPAPYRTILALAIPSSLTFVLMALETGLVNALLARLDQATAAIAAYSIYYRVVLFAMQPVIAIAVAMLPYAAKRIGGGDIDGVRSGFRQAASACLVYALLLVGPLMWWLAAPIARALTETETTMEYARFALYTVPFACFAGALFLLCRPVFEAMNRGRPGLIMAIFRYLVLTGPSALGGIWLANRMGQPALHGLVLGLLVAGSISSAVFLFWMLRELSSWEGRSVSS